MSRTGPAFDPAETVLESISVVRRREDAMTGTLAITGGMLIMKGVSTTVLIYSAVVAGNSRRPLSAVLLNPVFICFGAVHGVVGGLAILIGIRAFKGQPGYGTGLLLLGIVEIPAWILFFGGPIALARGVVLLVAGIHARIKSYLPRGVPQRA